MIYESRLVLVVGAADVVRILLVVGIELVVAVVLVVGVVDVVSVVDVVGVDRRCITATKVCGAIAHDRGCWHGALPGASQHTHLDWM